MKLLLVLATILAIVAPFNTTFAKNPVSQKIDSLGNIDGYPSNEGNEVNLTKTKTGCALNLTVYGESGQLQESYNFKANKLLSAYKVETSYQNGGLSNSQNKTIKSNKPIKTLLNVEQSQTLQDFITLKAKFPQTKLAVCNR